ncbi:MAG: hypothetical protein PHN80_15240 [Hespellia sp.]|nr:hypothetical protein [Hespellia sp.]
MRCIKRFFAGSRQKTQRTGTVFLVILMVTGIGIMLYPLTSNAVGESHVTLLVYTPYGSNTHRLQVRSARVEWENRPEVTVNSVVDKRFSNRTELILTLGSIVVVLMAAVVIAVKSLKNDRHRRKKNRKV